jgi:hypothetical protein
MKTLRAVAISAVLIAAGAYFLWPHLDRTASRVALSVTGLALILAWYSILDLQKQRQERFWPHTVDRLLRATFTAITLVFVFNFAWPSPPAPTEARPPPPETVEVRTQRFFDDVNALVRNHEWYQDKLTNVVAEHFATLKGNGRLPLLLAGEQMIELHADGNGVTVKLIH